MNNNKKCKKRKKKIFFLICIIIIIKLKQKNIFVVNYLTPPILKPPGTL